MINKIRYYIKHPRVFPGKIKRKIKNVLKPISVKIKPLPAITVIIPTYKPNDYISVAVDSVLKQKYPKRKIKVVIVVNGKDKDYYDNLKKVYDNENGINVIYTPVPSVSYARTYGLDFVKTPFITYLDDDDYFTPNYFLNHLKGVNRASIIISKMNDVKDNEIIKDTYINKIINTALNNNSTIYTKDYFKLASLFSTICGKIYKTKYLKTLDLSSDNLPHSEDVYFWVKNVSKINVTMKIVGNTEECYIRRIIDDSRSRPKNNDMNFYIYDRINMIELFEDELFADKNDLLAKRFILNKIKSQTQLMTNYYKTLNISQKKECLESIKKTKSLFLNKSLFGIKKGLAFCHNFPPFIDASAYVASKRLNKIDDLAGEIINWDVFSADMSNARSKDIYYDMFFASLQYTNIYRTTEKVYFNEKVQDQWGKKVYKMAEDMNQDYKYIYSRSMWAGSHIAAYLYKMKHPEVIWYAEFSDPIYKDTEDNIRATAMVYTGDEAYLNNFWYDVEKYVLENADKVLFTNENQKEYMLSYHDEKISDIENRSIVLNHPVINQKYSKIVESNYSIDNTKINIGFFGNFYKNRNGDSLLKFLKNPDVIIHLFTSNKDGIPDDNRIIINNQVSNLEFLNIASKMDYLYLNDVEFSGSINPYLPSKLADYIATGSPIIAVVGKGTELEKYYAKNTIKIYEVTDDFAKTLEKEMRFDLAICDLPYFKELYTSITLDYLGIAKDIISGNANLGFSVLKNPYMYDENNNIIWMFSETVGNDNTFYLYYYGLREIYILSKAFLIDNNKEYLTTAKKIVKSFYDNINKIDNNMLYNDHAQSERIENIVYLYSILKKYDDVSDIEDICISIINDALEKLLTDKYYQKNHNHGIIADKACLIGLAFLKEKNRITFVKNRLIAQIKYAFGDDGVHIENSVDYHYTVIQNLMYCLKVLDYLDKPIDEDDKHFINNIFDFMIYSYKPDGKRVLYGDSKGGYNKLIQTESYGNEKLKYTVTQGKKGEKPNETFKYFSSGYVFIREHFEKENFKDATWIGIKAGYRTRIHKHQDDLSMCLYSKGQDIFVDPGMYNYLYKDPIKDYMESLAAHTTICIKDMPYSIATGNSDKFKIINHQNNEISSHITCVSNVYSDTTIYRNINYYKDINVILIEDNIYSTNEHTYAQYFHLGKDIEIKKHDKTVELLLNNKEYHVNVIQLTDYDELNILKGLKTKPYSLISEGFAKYSESETLEYCKTGKNAKFITVIDISEITNDVVINNKKNNITLEKNNIKHKFIPNNQEYFSNDVKNVKVRRYKNRIILTNDSLGDKVHCIYIFGADKQDIVKTAYTSDKTINIECSYEKIVVIYYLKRNNVEKHGIIYTNINDKGKKYDYLHYPINIKHNMKKQDDGYEFSVTMDYDFPCNYKWFVYYNSSQAYCAESNNSSFYYKTDKAGEYVIIVSVTNKLFREVDFYQFDRIIIK